MLEEGLLNSRSQQCVRSAPSYHIDQIRFVICSLVAALIVTHYVAVTAVMCSCVQCSAVRNT